MRQCDQGYAVVGPGRVEGEMSPARELDQPLGDLGDRHLEPRCELGRRRRLAGPRELSVHRQPEVLEIHAVSLPTA